MDVRMDGGGIDALRMAILDGLPVIVLTEGHHEPAARDAATVAGRLGEYRVVHTARDSHGIPVTGASRLLAGNAEGFTDAFHGLRAIDPAQLAGEIGVLVIQACYVDMVGPDEPNVLAPHIVEALGAIANACADGAARRPILFTNAFVSGANPVVFGNHPWTVERTGYSGWAEFVFRFEPSDEHLIRTGPEADEDWLGAERACMAMHEIRREDGLAWIADGDRCVIVRRRPADENHGPRNTLHAFEMTPDGWCTGKLVTSPFDGGLTPEKVAWLAWRAGIGALGRPRALPGCRVLPMSMAACVRSLRDEGGTVQPGIRSILGDRWDGALMSAIASHPFAHAVVRKVRADPATRRARRDFALTWPAFASLLLAPDIAAAIDSGARTVPIVAAWAGVGQAVARRLVGRSMMAAHFPVPGIEPETPFHVPLAPFLEAIGYDRLPPVRDDRAWESFLACCGSLGKILNRGSIEGACPLTCAELLLGCGRDWPSREEAIRKIMHGTDEGGLGDAAAGLAEWLGHVGGRRVSTVQAFSLIARGTSLLRLHEVSLRWHADPNLMTGISGIPDAVTWPMPFGRVELPDGWAVVPMTNPRQLRDEGASGPDADGIAGLDHCVGGYARRCWSGESLILSVRRTRDGREERVTTAELEPRPDGFWNLRANRYELTQHFALRNGHAPMGAIRALAKLQEYLDRRMIPIDEAALAPRLGDPEIGSMRERAIAMADAWLAVLPRRLRHLSPDELAGMASGSFDRSA